MYWLADNILTPLGSTTEENYAAVRKRESRLHSQVGLWDIPEPFMASLFEDKASYAKKGFTLFESAVLMSVHNALVDTNIDTTNDNVVLIISTTKGNIDLLSSNENNYERIYPGIIAQRIAKEIGIKSVPIVVCNACISGLTAIILAQRLLLQGTYDYAIVCGCDIVNRFVVSGFQSLKVLSPDCCRPFDIERIGLNLGDAAATIIFSRKSNKNKQWTIEAGAIRNDAYHISSPSNKGVGLYRALIEVTRGKNMEDMALINTHGTGTLFNDQMEAMAINRAKLSALPVNALKGYYGHTMGAAGLLETILTMKALDDGIILGSKGFEELGVSVGINISSKERSTNKHSFIKILSGFGGCNAAIVVSKDLLVISSKKEPQLNRIHTVEITPKTVIVDEKRLETDCGSMPLLTYLYKQHISDYAKFYKMDMLSRLGFVATELLLKAEGQGQRDERDDRAIAFFNRSSSIAADKIYLQSIEDKNNNYPSPSNFVYTLPNIVIGEIAIRNHYHGETSFYILPQKDLNLMATIMSTMFQDHATKSIIGGWLDYEDEQHFEADISLYKL